MGSDRHSVGRPSKYGDTKGTSLRLKKETYELAQAKGVNVNAFVNEALSQYLRSDTLGIDEIEAENIILREKISANEVLIEEKKRVIAIMKERDIDEKVEGLIPAYWLRHFLVDQVKGTFKQWRHLNSTSDLDLDAFSISRENLWKIKNDIESGSLKPTSPLENWATYGFVVKSQKMKISARFALVKELRPQNDSNDS